MAKYITKDYLEQQFSHFKAQVADEKYIQIGKLKVNGTAISADDQKELNIEVPSAVSYRLALQSSPDAGFVATYNLQSKGTSEGEWSNVENSSKINIPKDYLIKSISEILTVVEADKAPGGKFETDASYAVGDKYVDFTVNSIGNDGVASHMYLKLTGTSITVDSALSDSSENPVQNKVIKSALDNKVDKVQGKGLSTNDYTNEEKNKLAGISEGAKANVQADWEEDDTTSDAYIKNKPTIPEGAVVDPDFSDSSTNPVQNKVIKEALDNKVDKVEGKGLSTNDYTNEEKSKLAGIPSGAEANVQSDWDVTDSSSDAFIKNKPEIPEAVTVDSELSSSSTNPVQNKIVKGALDNKVDKNGTDSLMTAEEHTKLGGMTAGAEPNKINSISLNGTNVAPDANKNVALTVITKAVNDLTNYYLKSETYTKTEINNIISNVKNGRFEVVQSLPTTDIDTATIYLVPKTSAQTQNIYDEYICLNDTTSPATWEKIGDTQIDLSNYVQKSSTAGLLKNDGTVDTNSYAKTSALNDYIAKSSTSGLVKNDGTIDTKTYLTATDINGKADKVSNATNGDLAGLNASGNLTDSGVKASNIIQKSSTAGLVKNDGTIDTTAYATKASVTAIQNVIPSTATSSNKLATASDIPSLTNYVQKSSTAGLLKNDGTVDTTQYATQSSITNITNVIPPEASNENKLATASDIIEKKVTIYNDTMDTKYYKIFEFVSNIGITHSLFTRGWFSGDSERFLVSAIMDSSHKPSIQGIVASGNNRNSSDNQYSSAKYTGEDDIILVSLLTYDSTQITRAYIKLAGKHYCELYLSGGYNINTHSYGTIYTDPTPLDEIVADESDHVYADERNTLYNCTTILTPYKKIYGSFIPNPDSTTTIVLEDNAISTSKEYEFYCSKWGIVPEDISISQHTCTIIMPKCDCNDDSIGFYLKVYW